MLMQLLVYLLNIENKAVLMILEYKNVAQKPNANETKILRN